MVESDSTTKKTKNRKIMKAVYTAFLIPFIAGMMLTGGTLVPYSYIGAGIAVMACAGFLYWIGIRESINDATQLERRISDLEEQIRELKDKKLPSSA